MTPTERIRNFSIIAHIDHGKSTLADRLLETTGTVAERDRADQFLDGMDLERERGITIKASPVRLDYVANDGEHYVLNLIDTPGHVDFSYEVSRSLSACEGAVLVVDASQGVEAQTLSNVYLALDHDLTIVPVLNKIDLPSADPERVRAELEDVIGIDGSDAILTSAKAGIGIEELLEAIVTRMPPPKGDPDAPLAALIFDSWFDPYHGAVVVVRVMNGRVRRGTKIRMASTGRDFEVLRAGVFSPAPVEIDELGAGEVGFLMAGIKAVDETRIGDTVMEAKRPLTEALPGFRPIQAVVFAGLYPSDSNQYEILREALSKLRMNDSSFSYEPETSLALGFGFRCGFLGLLHMEIVQERLEREYRLELVTTAPTVGYQVTTVTGVTELVASPAKLPPAGDIATIEEPFILASIHVPPEYLGAVFALCEEKRGVQRSLRYLTEERPVVDYELPLAEIVLDFYDRLKSATRGYASMEYVIIETRAAPLVKLDIKINGEIVDALSIIVHRDRAYARGRDLAARMKNIIPRQMFEIVIQASIGVKVIARETVKAMRKNVTAKCYGGDISRKRKLLEKQKEGKRRMKQVGSVEIPQEAFLAVLRVDGD